MRFLVLMFSFMLMACSSDKKVDQKQVQVQKAEVIEDITIPYFNTLRDSLDTLVILDVRTPAEWKEGIITGAVMMDYFSADFDKQLESLNKELPLLVYCRSGGRSSKTAIKLKEMGFSKVYNLREGTTAWYRTGREVVIPEIEDN